MVASAREQKGRVILESLCRSSQLGQLLSVLISLAGCVLRCAGACGYIVRARMLDRLLGCPYREKKYEVRGRHPVYSPFEYIRVYR